MESMKKKIINSALSASLFLTSGLASAAAPKPVKVSLGTPTAVTYKQSLKSKSLKYVNMELSHFIFLSTNKNFRNLYFKNLDRLAKDYIVTSFVLGQIQQLDLGKLNRVIVNGDWSEIRSSLDIISTNHTDSHTSHNDNSHSQNDYRQHSKDVDIYSNFDWVTVLEKYAQSAPTTSYVKQVIQVEKVKNAQINHTVVR